MDILTGLSVTAARRLDMPVEEQVVALRPDRTEGLADKRTAPDIAGVGEKPDNIGLPPGIAEG